MTILFLQVPVPTLEYIQSSIKQKNLKEKQELLPQSLSWRQLNFPSQDPRSSAWCSGTYKYYYIAQIGLTCTNGQMLAELCIMATQSFDDAEPKCKWQGPLTLAIIYHLWCMGTRDRRAMNRGLWIMNGRLVLPLLVFMWFARLYILDWALVRRGASVICSNGKWIIIVLNTSFRTLCITDHVLAIIIGRCLAFTILWVEPEIPRQVSGLH